MAKREQFGSRLGFILVSAGCAVGLGNVWKFPYMAGQYGGAAFILIYLAFLVLLGVPVMVAEFTIGRGAQKSIVKAFDTLEPKGTKWHSTGYLGFVGNYMLMMFYTTVAGWLLYYLYKTVTGTFNGMTPDEVGGVFGGMLSSGSTLVFWMVVTVLAAFGVCVLGLKNGVEKITTVMMAFLLVLMIIIAARVLMLPGAEEGLKYYLIPDFARAASQGWGNVIFGAMSQAFFTLSLGIGSMMVMGSYLGKDRSITGEAISVTIFDTFVALIAGLIIIPSCFAFGVDVGAGPGLIFITLPNIFNAIPGGQLWGTMFFIFMVFAALSTVIAVFENIIAFAMDLWGWTRQKAVGVNIVAVIVLSVPCALGFNVLAGFVPFGPGSGVLDLEDFIVSTTLLPLGSLIIMSFCSQRYGWGWDNFLKEANTGTGLKFMYPRFYVMYVIPAVVAIIFVKGYYDFFLGQGMNTTIGVGIALALLAVTGYIMFGRNKDTVPNE
ncbi:MAG: sodium-dependent transporter [Peptostreptococcaceae bacterium]|nr:sodium-dependent transporter [Peptostreptococcaceae bacterium]